MPSRVSAELDVWHLNPATKRPWIQPLSLIPWPTTLETSRFFIDTRLTSEKKKHQPTSAALAVTQVPGFSVQNVNKEFSIDELLFDLRKAKAKSVGLDQIGYPMLKKIPPM